MNTKHVAPEFGKSAFHCPHCNAFTEQKWTLLIKKNLLFGWLQTNIFFYYEHIENSQSLGHLANIEAATCSHCKEPSLWLCSEQKQIYPMVQLHLEPAQDMPGSVKELYEEARSIANMSVQRLHY